MALIDFIAAVAGKLVLSVFLGFVAIVTPLLPPPSSPAVIPQANTSVPPPAIATSTTKVAVETQKPKPKPDTIQNPPPPPPPAAPAVQPPTAPAPALPSAVPTGSSVNDVARASIVNILCTTKNDGALHPLTASGVFIDSRGVILTNAHVGQYLLLKNYLTPNFVECVARTGNPAYPRYKLGLLHISSEWVRDNASQIDATNPLGTGENDFALLYVIGSTNPNEKLPESFPSAALDSSENTLAIGVSTLLAAYPAGFLGGTTVQRDLYLASAETTIKEVYTFGTTSIDVISIGGSVVAQKGSSGGGVFSVLGRLLAVISTSSEGSTTDIRDLHAITLAHIDRSLREHDGTSLFTILSGNIPDQAAAFAATTAPTLTKLLTDQL